jgi:hypothetical protein
MPGYHWVYCFHLVFPLCAKKCYCLPMSGCTLELVGNVAHGEVLSTQVLHPAVFIRCFFRLSDFRGVPSGHRKQDGASVHLHGSSQPRVKNIARFAHPQQ